MSEFPFNLVYDHFAKRTVDARLSPPFSPILAFALVVDEQLASVDVVPQEFTQTLFSSANTGDLVQEFIADAMKNFEGQNACLVMIAHGIHRKARKDTLRDEVKKIVAEMKSGVEMQDVAVMIAIHTPAKVQTGFLPLGPDGAPIYRPLEEGIEAGQMFSSEDMMRPVESLH